MSHSPALPQLLYLDTSALVKRYLAEPGSPEMRAAVLVATGRVTSVVAYAETRSAFHRAERDGRMEHATHMAAVTLLNAHWLTYTRLAVDDACALEAGRLIEAHARHALRGFDAIHLASAHRLAAGRPNTVSFACWDRRLWRAAQDDGFAMVPIHDPTG